MKILLYGRLADAIGREVELNGPGCTVGELRTRLAANYPLAAEALRQSRAVADDAVIGEDTVIAEPGIIELIPAVCGG